MTRRLHTAFSRSASVGNDSDFPRAAPRSAGDRRRNEDSSRKPTPAGRAAPPTAPPRAGAAGFGRLRAVSACSGVERVETRRGVRRDRGEVAGSAARGSATRTSRRSPLPEPAGRAGKEPGGGVPPPGSGPVERRRRSVPIFGVDGGDGVRSRVTSGAAPARWSFRVAFRVFPTRTRAQALRRSEAHPSLAAYRHRPGRRTLRTSQYTARHYNTAETPAWSTGLMPPIMHALSTVLIHGSLRPHPP